MSTYTYYSDHAALLKYDTACFGGSGGSEVGSDNSSVAPRYAPGKRIVTFGTPVELPAFLRANIRVCM